MRAGTPYESWLGFYEQELKRHALKIIDREDMPQAARELAELAERYNMKLDPYAKVWQLSVGQQQRLEILKALYRGADLLVLDEPTAVLTPQEVTELFKMLHTLTDEGHTVIFITHKLAEVMEICQRCTVLRLGKLEATVDIKDITDKQQLANLMVGKDVKLTTDRPEAHIGQTVLDVAGLNAMNAKNLPALKDVTFNIRQGEIMGVAGVDGNGQSELAACLAGLNKVVSGTIQINGTDTTHCKPRAILEQGVSHIPEDRHKMGMVKEMSVKENLIMMTYYKRPYSKHGFLDWKWIKIHAEEMCETYNVRTPSVEEPMGNLSGGNQQKVVVGREIDRNPDFLLAMHPARGLDIGATKYIQSRIMEERNKGKAVLLISSELDEVMELSDRIMVMYEGEIMGIVDSLTATRESIAMMMAGSRLDSLGKAEAQ